MARKVITMPQLGESVVEGTVGAWLKSVGDEVQRFEPLLEVVTDKVNTEIPSEFAGVLREILVEEGATVQVGTPLCVIETADAETAEEGTPAGEPAAEAEAGRPGAARPEAAATVAAEPARAAATPEGLPRGLYSPLVRRLAKEHGVDLRQVTGTGAGGRVTKADVLAFVERRERAAAPAAAPSAAAPTGPASPAAAAAPAGALPPVAVEPGDEIITPDPMRSAIARHMVASKQTAPHAWMMMEADVSGLVALREAHKAAFAAQEGVPLTFVPFFVKAVVDSLKQFPHLNAAWQDERIVVKKRINVGIAVGLEEGLVVPVIHDADRLSIAGLAHAVADLAERARAGKLRLDDVQGGTITVNNTGAFGSVASYPIINQPQAAIITMEAVRRTPVAVGDAIAIRSVMNMCISFDHRVTDGLYAGRFLQSVKQRLESYGPDTALY